MLRLFQKLTSHVAARRHPTHKRLGELHAELFDATSTFSVSATLAELDALERGTVPDGVDNGRVMHLRALVESKAGRPEDSIRHAEEALRIHALQPFLTHEERKSQHYDIAAQAEDSANYAKAVAHFQQALTLMTDDGTTQNQRLGTKQRLAFCLHEIGHYGEALRFNTEALTGASALFGQASPKLFSTRTNLAQNQYALGEHDAARKTLEHLLVDALEARDEQVADTALFQLGVLAFEDGQQADALAFMQRRLALAAAAKDQSLVGAAERDLAVLRSKVSGDVSHTN